MGARLAETDVSTSPPGSAVAFVVCDAWGSDRTFWTIKAWGASASDKKLTTYLFMDHVLCSGDRCHAFSVTKCNQDPQLGSEYTPPTDPASRASSHSPRFMRACGRSSVPSDCPLTPRAPRLVSTHTPLYGRPCTADKHGAHLGAGGVSPWLTNTLRDHTDSTRPIGCPSGQS